MNFQMPNSKFLKGLMGWMIVGAFLKIINLFQADPQTTERLIASFLAGLIGKFVLGAFWSGFPLVYVSAMIAAGVFVTAVMMRGPYSRSAANYSFITIMYLSFFCIWVEPWLSPSGLIVNLLLILLGLFSVVIEIVVTIVWLFLWWGTTDELKREL